MSLVGTLNTAIQDVEKFNCFLISVNVEGGEKFLRPLLKKVLLIRKAWDKKAPGNPQYA